MNFKKRLIVAFLLMTVFPILLLTSLGYVVLKYQAAVMKQKYEVEVGPMQAFQNPVQVLSRLSRGIFNELQSVASDVPENLLDTAYLEETDLRLQKRQAFLVVLKENDVLFCGNRDVYNVLVETLPRSGIYAMAMDGGLYISGRIPCLVKQHVFDFPDGTAGRILVISDVSTVMPQLRSSLRQTVFGGLLIFLITGGLVIWWLYSGVVRPINKLQNATKRVKSGDLDFSLKKTGNDEIGELSEDFEEMRAHLKQEIDARIRYEEDLRMLISNIAHDLKTPLTIVKGYAEGLMDGVAATPEKQEKYVRTIRSKAEDMTALVEELSLYAKIESKVYPYFFERVNLVNFFSDYIEEDAPILEEQNISLKLENKLVGSAEVFADREQLKRVVANIIGNAVKYLGKEKGQIVISLTEDGNRIQTGIKDNGIGIPAEDLSHVFERFYRGDASRHSGMGGSGLGLSIVKQIIEDHNGSIFARSTEGEGTEICFSLKRAEAGAVRQE